MHAQATLAQVVAHAKEYGFLYPCSEIYGGLQALYDYGPYGVALKRNVQQFWWQSMTRLPYDVVGIDTSILMHPGVWQASGHVSSFHDIMVDHKDSKKRYRVDALVADHAEALRTQGHVQAAQKLTEELASLTADEDINGLSRFLCTHQVPCPVAKTAHWTPVRKFNLMLSTKLGAEASEAEHTYLRPETAQGIFVNFLNVQKSTRAKVPFGIAQIGKAFRNEIVARQFIFRMREFEQMEMQFFVQPDTQHTWFARWQERRFRWYQALGIPEQRLRVETHDQLAHYAQEASDIQYAFSFGAKEVEGIHSRTDFDLKAHQQHAKKKMQYFDPQLGKSYIPCVVETSVGCDRLILMLLMEGLVCETGGAASAGERRYLKLPPPVAPVQLAILPLVRKDGLPERARNLTDRLRLECDTTYDDVGSIGKRYARQDLIGTPYCLTVDHQTLEDNTITVRDRDSAAQTRISVDALGKFIAEKLSLRTLLAKL